MKQKLLNLKSWLLMMCLLVGVGSAWAETVTITLADSGGDSDGTSKIASSGATIDAKKYSVSTTDFVSDIVAGNAYVFQAKSDCGWKFGNSNNAGKITINLKDNVEIVSVKVTAKYASSKVADLKIGGGTAQALTADFADYTQNYASGNNTNSIVIETALHTSGDRRAYITSIVITTAGGGSGDNTPTALSVPSNLSASSITTTGATLSWDAVTNASSYTVKIGEVEYADVKTNSYSATGLTAGTQYTWTVKAVGDGTNYSTGDYASNATFTTDELTPAQKFNVTVVDNILNGVVSADPVQATAGTEVTLTATPASGYKFSAWDVKDANDNAITVTNNKFTMPEADVNVSATFVEKPEPAGQTVAFVLEYGGKMLAAGVNIASSKAPAVEVTVKDGKVYVSEEDAEKIAWLLTESETEGKYLIQPNNSTDKYLSATSTSANLSLFTNECLWTAKEEDGTYWVGSYSRTLLYQANTTNAFKAYASGNINTKGYASKAAVAMPIVVVPTYTLSEFIAKRDDFTENDIFNVKIEEDITIVDIETPSDGGYIVKISPDGYMRIPISAPAPTPAKDWTVGGTLSGILSNVTCWNRSEIVGEDASVWEGLTYKPIQTYTLSELFGTPSKDYVNAEVDDVIESCVKDAGVYKVTLNSGVSLMIRTDNLDWVADGTVKGTLNDVQWRGDNNTIYGKTTDYWKEPALIYTAPVTATYNVTILTDEIENGTVTADMSTAAEGETVTLTITPEEGYTLAQLMVTNLDTYDEIEVEDNAFVMPAADVEVFAYFMPVVPVTYTLNDIANGKVEANSMVSVSFNNEIIELAVNEDTYAVVLKDGDNSFMLMANVEYNSEWKVGGTLAGNWNAMYLYQMPNSGAYMLINMTEEPWAGLTYKPYTEKSLTLVAQDKDGYYATFSSDKVTFFPDDYIVSAVGVENGKLYQFKNDEAFDDDIVEINGKDVIGYYVPANTGVLIYSVENTVNYYTVAGVTPSIGVEAVNMLRPASAAMEGDFKFYKLAYDDYANKTGLGFYYGAENGAAFDCKAGLAYLAVPTASAAKAFTLNPSATAIKSANTTSSTSAIYNLAGQRLNALQKGINIVGGKKVLVK